MATLGSNHKLGTITKVEQDEGGLSVTVEVDEAKMELLRRAVNGNVTDDPDFTTPQTPIGWVVGLCDMFTTEEWEQDAFRSAHQQVSDICQMMANLRRQR